MANDEHRWRTYDVGNTRHFRVFDRYEHRLVLDEGERQMLLRRRISKGFHVGAAIAARKAGRSK